MSKKMIRKLSCIFLFGVLNYGVASSEGDIINSKKRLSHQSDIYVQEIEEPGRKKILRTEYQLSQSVLQNNEIVESQDDLFANTATSVQEDLNEWNGLEFLQKKLHDSDHIKDIAQLLNLTDQDLIDRCISDEIKISNLDEIGVAIEFHNILRGLQNNSIEKPLHRILLDLLIDQSKEIIFNNSIYTIVGGQGVSSKDDDILNFIAQHKNLRFNLAPVIEIMISKKIYKASVCNFIEENIHIASQSIPSINKPDNYGRMPLEVICSDTVNINEMTPGVVRFLLSLGAQVNPQDPLTWSPLANISRSFREEALEIIPMLLSAGADVNAFRNPLTAACSTTSPNISDRVRLLLSAGANVHFVDELGWTPLMRACHNGNKNSIEAVRLLLKAGANINVKNNKNETPLFWACSYNTNPIAIDKVKLLLDAGAKRTLGLRNPVTTPAIDKVLACYKLSPSYSSSNSKN